MYQVQKLPISQISIKTGMSKATISRRLNKFNIPTRRITKPSKRIEALIIKEYTDGNSVRKVGKILNLSNNIIFNCLKRNSILRTKSEAIATIDGSWGDIEIEILTKLFYDTKLIDIKNRFFPDRTLMALSNKVLRLGLYKGHRSESYRNNANALGNKHTEETKKKISKAHKGKIISQGVRDKMSKACVGKKRSKEFAVNASTLMINQWKNPEFAKKMAKAFNLKPNKKEIELYGILNKVCPEEYKFVGNGGIVIDGLIPDFININGQKKIIEFFGDYWHSEEITKGNYRRSETGRKAIFAGYGYKTLVIWQSEFERLTENDIKEKIIKFNNL